MLLFQLKANIIFFEGISLSTIKLETKEPIIYYHPCYVININNIIEFFIYFCFYRNKLNDKKVNKGLKLMLKKMPLHFFDGERSRTKKENKKCERIKIKYF